MPVTSWSGASIRLKAPGTAVAWIAWIADDSPTRSSSSCVDVYFHVTFMNLFIHNCNYSRSICPSTSGARPSSGNNLFPLMFITPKMPEEKPNLELAEFLNLLAGSGQDTQDVESDLLSVSSCHMTITRKPPSRSRRTVLLRGRHWPTVTWSPSSTRNAGETWAARFLCRFS